MSEAALNLPFPPPARPRKQRAPKAPGAFLTIGELAHELQVEQHVLRFWESKFPQIQPLKRAGGRRYYRSEDVELLRRIQTLLYRDGYTIRGVQNLLDGHAPQENSAPIILRERPAVVAAISDALAATNVTNPEINTQTRVDVDYVKIPRQNLQKLVDALAKLRELVTVE